MQIQPPLELAHQSQHVAWRLFLTVHALACRQIDESLCDAGCLSFDDYDVLLTVNEGPDETMRMSELASKVLLSNSGMTRRVARLVERGLLIRTQSAEDGRVFEVTLSEKGRDALETTWSFYQNKLQEVFIGFLSEKEARQMGKIFQRILNQIGGEEYQGLLEAEATDAPKPRR